MHGRLAAIAATMMAAASPAAAHAAGWTPTGPTVPQDRLMLSGFADGNGLAAFAGGTMFKTTDFGSTWTPLTTPPPGGASMELRMGSPTAGWGSNNGFLSKTTDGANTWTQVPYPPVVTDANTASGLGTTDAGRTVSFDVDGFDVRDGCPYPSTTSVLTTSHDAGATWTRFTLPTDSSGWTVRWRDADVAVAEVFPVKFGPPVRDGSTCSSSGTQLGTDLLVTEDGGATWRKVFHDNVSYIYSLAWTKGGRLVIAKGTGEVRVSDDLGHTFTQVADINPTDDIPFGVWSIDATAGGRVYALRNGGGLMVSDDRGATWHKEASPFDAFGIAVGEVLAFDAEHGVAGGPQPLSARTTAIPDLGLPPIVGQTGSVVLRQRGRTLRIAANGRVTASRITIRRR